VKVTAEDGSRPSLLQSSVRNTVKLVTVLSPVFLILGFVAVIAIGGFLLAPILVIAFVTMPAWTARKQALQDMIAKCLVVDTPA
jgi:uncharacterized RDD family membrane protein YckC